MRTTIKNIVEAISYDQFVKLAAGCHNEQEVIDRWETQVEQLRVDEEKAEAAKKEFGI